MLQGQVALGGHPWRTPPPRPLLARAQARARAGTLPTRLPRLLTSRACAGRPLLPRAEPVPPGALSQPERASGGQGTPGCSGAECGSGWQKPERSLEGSKTRKGPRDAWGPGVLPLSPLHLALARLASAGRHSETPMLPLPSRPSLCPAPQCHRNPEEAASELGGWRGREILNSRPKCFLSSRERDVPRGPAAATRLGVLGV